MVPEVGNQEPDTGSRKPEVRNLEVGNRKSETGSRKPEVRNQKSEALVPYAGSREGRWAAEASWRQGFLCLWP
jgi:hypothetical protein